MKMILHTDEASDTTIHSGTPSTAEQNTLVVSILAGNGKVAAFLLREALLTSDHQDGLVGPAIADQIFQTCMTSLQALQRCWQVGIPAPEQICHIVEAIPLIIEVVSDLQESLKALPEGAIQLCLESLRAGVLPIPLIPKATSVIRQQGRGIDPTAVLAAGIANHWPIRSLTGPADPPTIDIRNVWDLARKELRNVISTSTLRQAVVHAVSRVNVSDISEVCMMLNLLGNSHHRTAVIRKAVAHLLSRVADESGDPEVCLTAIQTICKDWLRHWLDDSRILSAIKQCIWQAFRSMGTTYQEVLDNKTSANSITLGLFRGLRAISALPQTLPPTILHPLNIILLHLLRYKLPRPADPQLSVVFLFQQTILLYFRHLDEVVAQAISPDEILSTNSAMELQPLAERVIELVRTPLAIETLDRLVLWSYWGWPLELFVGSVVRKALLLHDERLLAFASSRFLNPPLVDFSLVDFSSFCDMTRKTLNEISSPPLDMLLLLGEYLYDLLEHNMIVRDYSDTRLATLNLLRVILHRLLNGQYYLSPSLDAGAAHDD